MDDRGLILIDYFRQRQEALLAALREHVERETPSTDKPALDAYARWLADRLAVRGATVTLVTNATGGDHVLATVPGPGAEPPLPPALVLGHFDTVWPLGTVAARPPRLDGGKFFGPGAFDMKAGLALAEAIVEGTVRQVWSLPRPLVLLLTSDEEIGSPTSRALVEAKAREAAYVLVLEPPLPGGALKTARKGVGRFTLDLRGVAAHAGLEPEKGRSAIEELAHQILRLHALTDHERGTTVNVGVVHGGTRPNVVADHAVAEVDVRVWTAAEAERVSAAIRATPIHVPGVTIEVSGGLNRPPMEPTPATIALVEQAQRLARALGFHLGTGAVGGGSDGNFTAAVGAPTLDGLGAPGGGAHALDEHVEVAALALRGAFLTALLQHLRPEE